MSDLPRRWLAPNTPELYSGLPYDRHAALRDVPHAMLPPLPRLDGTFDWLRREPLTDDPIPMVVDCAVDAERFAKGLERRAAEVGALGFALPPSFSRFMSEGLANRMRSYFGGYFELGDIERHGPAWVLPFFLDPQTYCWSLRLEAGAQDVVFAHPDTPGELTVCARSFEAFIYRFWAEHSLAIDASEATEELRAYRDATNS